MRYDVAIIGAGPAGATAAILLARKDYDVALVDRETIPGRVRSAGWLNARVAPLLKELKVAGKPFLKYPIKDVTFYNADLSKSAKPGFDQTPGYLIDRVEFSNTLAAKAASAGVSLMHGCAATNVRLKESSVIVERGDQEPVESTLLLIASGWERALVDRVGFVRPRSGMAYWTAQVDAPPKAGSARRSPRVVVVLGLDKPGSFGVCLVSSRHMAVTINWLQERDDAVSVCVDLCRAAFERGIVPLDLSASAANAVLTRSPASIALDLETHVGKHTLLIGDCGGFVTAASNESIYPAMWSARIAVDVIDKALQGRSSQDELMAFNSRWRIDMADYLRPPNTDPQFLLPLVFSNQSMADRMGAAFFCGETI